MSLQERITHIESRLAGAMIRDRYEIWPRLRLLKRGAARAKQDKRLVERLSVLENLVEASCRRQEARLHHQPGISYPRDLPIFDRKEAIVRAVGENQVVIVSGDTGSGKSTQIPKMCLEAGQGIAGVIGCTQPRRIAATTIGRRIAEELGQDLGKAVGYKVRFTDRTSPQAYIKIMTDGILLAETQQDPLLAQYDTLIIDEAHERSVNIDFVLGILKTLLPKRKELKVIITSATLDTEKFSAAFNDAPVVEVAGRMYPVTVEYKPLDPDLEEAGEVTYVDGAVKAVEDLRRKRRLGDILIFMPTEQDIRETCELLEARRFAGARVLPLFARLPAREQQRVFSSSSGQKIVVATNVAETSLTIPGIRYVIDTGLARIPRYVARTRTSSLPICPISRSSADQRKGRCGRVKKGTCIRLYSEEDYETRPEFTPPEILRSNLAEVILRMLSLNLGRIKDFPFVDPPNPRSIKDGFDLLRELGAIEPKGNGHVITKMGRHMARLPMDPRISRMMLEARKEGCMGEVAVIASALSIQDPKERPADKTARADQAHGSFKDPDSDFLTLLNIWDRYHRTWESLKTQNKMRRFCKDHFLSFMRMREWRDVHEQVTTILKEQGIKLQEGPRNQKDKVPLSRYARIHRSILSGYLSNIAQKKDKNIYLAARGREVMIFPGSTLFNQGCPWIVAAEMVKTSRLFARTAARIDEDWLEALGGDLSKSSYSGPHWEKNRGEVRAYEQVTLYGLVIVPRRPVSYGPLFPEEAHRIFVRSGLVEDQVKERFPFLEHNRALKEGLATVEDKIRRRNILVSEEAMARFYSERLQGVYDIAGLRKRIRERGGDGFLKMDEDDLLLNRPGKGLLDRYPDKMTVGDQDFRFSYKFSPGADTDGVTIKIPTTLASRFPVERLEWVVPGLYKEKITALIKGLPKRYRRRLVPVSKKVDIIEAEMGRTNEPLVTALARFIYQRFGVDIPASEWPDQDLPDHLKIRVAITDHKGRELEAGRDPVLLTRKGRAPAAEVEELGLWRSAREQWERTGITTWDFGTLPEQLALGPNLAAYPGLSLEEDSVAIRLFTSPAEALGCHKKGVEALFRLALKKELKFLKRGISLPERVAPWAVAFGGRKALEGAVFESLMHRLFRLHIRSPEAFSRHLKTLRPSLDPEAKGLLDLTGKVLEAFHRTHTTLHTLDEANRSNRALLGILGRIRGHLKSLVPQDFVQRYSMDRLAHLPRYLKAMELRAERAAHAVERDRKKAALAETFVQTLEELKTELSAHSSQEKREALEAFEWTVEEYKVSLFAQELKTPFPVSAKRLQKKADEIKRMV